MLRSYNFNPEDAEDHDWRALYEVRRRDALFAFTIQESQGSALLGRDHLGAIPLFYRVRNGIVESSTSLSDLVHGDETLDELGVTAFVALGTAKVISPFREIQCVEPGTVMRVFSNGDSEILYRYRFTPKRTSLLSPRMNEAELDRLLRQAARRALGSSVEVGLYLSGGIDSGLSGHYLGTQGATLRAYTTTPWGPDSSEARLARANADRIGAAHFFAPFATDAYTQYVEHALSTYANPVGASSMLAIAAIGHGTLVSRERVICFAQNADTATASVADQSLLYFASFVPRFLRRRLHRLLTSPSVLDNLVALRSAGLLTHIPFLKRFEHEYSTLEQLTLAGMLFAHTPVDGDIVIQTSLRSDQRVTNLFYDIDVIEFLMGIPLWQRLSFSKESKYGIAIRKNILRALARRVLPKEVVERKKGLSVPVLTDRRARVFFDSLPSKIGARTLTLPQHRFAAHLLHAWSKTLPKIPEALRTLFHEN